MIPLPVGLRVDPDVGTLRNHDIFVQDGAPNDCTTPDLDVTSRGTLAADENGVTSKAGVFAGGDIVSGGATVISAMGAGRRAARAIDRYLQQESDSRG